MSTRPTAHAAGEAQWLFTRTDLEHTPSRLQGIPFAEELLLRRKGLTFILSTGIALKLDQITLATAQTYLQRFYMRNVLQTASTPKGAHHYQVAAASVYLAYKAKENPRRMHELVVAVCRVAAKNKDLMVDEQSKEFWRWKDSIHMHENIMLESLCFDLDPVLPYEKLYYLLKDFEVAENKKLRNVAWAVVTDSFTTTLCLLARSEAIAAGALYLGLRHCGDRLMDGEGGVPWWIEANVSREELELVVTMMCEAYEAPPVRSNPSEVYEGLEGDWEATRMETPRWEGTPRTLPQGEEPEREDDEMETKTNVDGQENGMALNGHVKRTEKDVAMVDVGAGMENGKEAQEADNASEEGEVG